MKNNILRSHIRKVRFFKVIAILFFLVAVVGLLGAVWVSEASYRQWLAPKAEDPAAQIQTILRAIDLRPKELEGYENILDIYLSDGLLTKQEDSQFRELMNTYQEKLSRNQEGAAILYRRVAFDYISSYDAGPEERLKSL